MKFLADECFFIATVKMLRAKGYEVDTILERGLSGISDEEIIQLCIKENRCLLTLDTDFGNIFHFPIGSNPGIVLVKIKPPTIEDCSPAILSFFGRNEPEVFSRGLTIITKNKIIIQHITDGNPIGINLFCINSCKYHK